MNTKNSKFRFTFLYNWLFSIKTGLVLLCLIVVISIFETLLSNINQFEQYIYNSFFFKLLLVLLSVNLACSTFKTIIKKLIPLTEIQYKADISFYISNTPSDNFIYENKIDNIKILLKKNHFKIYSDKNSIYAKKNIIAYYGSVISHYGLIIVLIGGLFSSVVSKEGYMKLNEGQTSNLLMTNNNNTKQIPLNFYIRCEDFYTEYYPKTNINSNFISTLTIIENNSHETTKLVEVNKPLTIKGWKIYQSGWELHKTKNRYLFEVLKINSSENYFIKLSVGQKRSLPHRKDVYIELDNNLKCKLMTYCKDELVNTNSASLNSDSDWKIIFIKKEPAYITELKFVKNPIIPIIYFGCILIISGIILAFFINPKQAWILYDKNNKKLYITARYKYPIKTFDKTINKIINNLKRVNVSYENNK